jgi:hypothetical protein
MLTLSFEGENHAPRGIIFGRSHNEHGLGRPFIVRQAVIIRRTCRSDEIRLYRAQRGCRAEADVDRPRDGGGRPDPRAHRVTRSGRSGGAHPGRAGVGARGGR